MTDKLEALSQPVAVVVNKYGDPEAFGERELKLLADLQKVPYNTNFYSQEYVTALLAALEEANKRAELESVGADKSAVNAVEWMKRANAAEQREDHLKATVDVLSAKNAELQQRLQQPIKLPQRKEAIACGYDGDGCLANRDDGDCFDRDEVIEALKSQGFKVEGE